MYLYPALGKALLALLVQSVVKSLKGLDEGFGFLVFLSSLAVNDLVIDGLADTLGEFFNRPLEDTLVVEPLPSPIPIGSLGVVDVVVPSGVVGGVAEAVAGVGCVAPEGDVVTVNGGGKVLDVVLLGNSKKGLGVKLQ